jgi:ComEC/Rec2-related protein
MLNLLNEFKINLFQFQPIASIFLILGIYANISITHFGALFVGFLFALPHLNYLSIRLSIFLLIGLFRGAYFQTEPERYTFKNTSFQAEIVDVYEREEGSYLHLKNFQFVKRNDELDEYAQFPKQALMKIEEGLDRKHIINGKIEAVGRFFFPVPDFFLEKNMSKLPKGKIKRFEIIQVRKTTFKNFCRRQFDKYLSPGSAKLVKAIFLSDTFAVPTEIRRSFQNSGMAHLLGVSVLNIGIISFFFYNLFYYLFAFLCPRIAFYIPFNILGGVGSCLSILFYCYLVGFEYPLLRASMMNFLSVIGFYYGRGRGLEYLCLSAAAILLFSPEALYDIGFQLSFGGVLGIYAFYRKFSSYLISSLWVTFSATLLLTPITIYNFQTINIQPFLANFFAIPYSMFVLTPLILANITLMSFNVGIFAWVLDYAVQFFIQLSYFFEYFSLPIKFYPIDFIYVVIFALSVVLYAVIKERLRYAILAFGNIVFLQALIRSFIYQPFILVHPYGIGLFLKDKIVVYPKCGFIGQIWSNAYHLPCEDGRNSVYFKKDACKKIVIMDKIGVFLEGTNGYCSLETKKDYYINIVDLKEMKKIPL